MAAMAVLGLMSLGTVQAGNVSGRVVSLSDAKGVPNAMVTLEFAEGSPGAAAVTVFSSDDGHFSVSGNDQQSLKGANIRVSKPGFRVADDMALALSGKEPELSIVLKPTDNIADAVPASAWFEQTPAGDERNITLTSCSSCHQMASPRVRECAAQIEAVSNGPGGDARALEEWRKVVRHESCRAMPTITVRPWSPPTS